MRGSNDREGIRKRVRDAGRWWGHPRWQDDWREERLQTDVVSWELEVVRGNGE